MAPFLADVFASQVSHMDIEVWVEPFAGGAGAGLTLLDRDAVSEVWLTEKHPAIAALWRTIISQPGPLATRVETAVPSLDDFANASRLVGAPDGAEDFELAFAALVVNRCSRSGIIAPGVGPIGGKSQSGRWTLTSRWNGKALADRVRHVGSFGSRLRFAEGDAIETIAGLAGSGIEDEVMLFVDPPYIREGNGLYANGMTEQDHQRLADALNACPARWLLTYDDEPVVARELYPHRRVLAYEIPNTANRARIATEHAVLSDGLRLEGTGIEVLPGRSSQWVRERALAA